MEFSPDQQDRLLTLARQAMRAALSGGPAPDPPPDDDPSLGRPAGCFVSLHDRATGRLRGCIGHLEAQWPLVRAVARMSVAALKDPRFTDHPVRLAELDDLAIEITVLAPLQRAAHPLDFDPLRHGVHLTLGDRRGCFLPQVARERRWSAEQTLNRLCAEKMGLPQDAWKSPRAVLERFEVVVVGPR